VDYQPYRCGTDRSLFKWKWEDTVTADFQVIPDPYRVTCSAQGLRDGLDMSQQIKLEGEEVVVVVVVAVVVVVVVVVLVGGGGGGGGGDDRNGYEGMVGLCL